MNLRNIFTYTILRQHMVRVAELIASGMDTALMQDPKRPIVIGVDGDPNSGKKIFPDIVRDIILGPDVTVTGQPEFDEYAEGSYGGIPLTVTFINAAKIDGFSDPQLDDLPRNQGITRFLAQRRFGGVTFINNYSAVLSLNDEDRMPDILDLTLHVNSSFDQAVQDEIEALAVSPRFNAEVTKQNPRMIRRIEFRVNTRLAENPVFASAMMLMRQEANWAGKMERVKGIEPS